MEGKLIVIEGLDGSGKATQAKKLYEKLKKDGKPVIQVSYPDYSSDSSALIKMYLSGEFGSDPDSVNSYAASSFYAVDRYASYVKNWREFYFGGGTVIADRYTTSNAVHQCAKLPREKWDGFIEWLFEYEYDLIGIPRPYRTIYLHVDLATSQQLLAKRYNGRKDEKDIHEGDMDYLRRCEEAASYCAKKLGWSVIECVSGGTMESVDSVFEKILGALK